MNPALIHYVRPCSSYRSKCSVENNFEGRARNLCPGHKKKQDVTFNFCTFLCVLKIWLFLLFSLRILIWELYYTNLFKLCTLSLLKYFFFSFATSPLFISPKRDMWSPEVTLLASSLILPHVPGMKLLIFLFCTYMYTNNDFDLCFCYCKFSSLSE